MEQGGKEGTVLNYSQPDDDDDLQVNGSSTWHSGDANRSNEAILAGFGVEGIRS